MPVKEGTPSLGAALSQALPLTPKKQSLGPLALMSAQPNTSLPLVPMHTKQVI